MIRHLCIVADNQCRVPERPTTPVLKSESFGGRPVTAVVELNRVCRLPARWVRVAGSRAVFVAGDPRACGASGPDGMTGSTLFEGSG